MISIKEAKARTRILKTFLKEQSVELPHGVVLEAIARLEHHKNWATFLVSASKADALVRVLDEIKYWPRFVLFFDEREENGFEEALYVMPNGTLLDNMGQVGFGGLLDDEKGLQVPAEFVLNAKVVVTSVHSSVPDIAKYGMPWYADERAAAFFREELDCAALNVVETSVTDTGDASSARYWFEVRVEPAYAGHLLNSSDASELAQLTEEQLMTAAYEKVFLRVFTDTNDQPVARIMDALQKGSGFATNAESYLQRTVDELITLNGPYELLSTKDLFTRLKGLAKIEFEKRILTNVRK